MLTHSDPDHTGLAKTLRDQGARVMIHAADEPTLRRPRPKSGDANPIKIVPELRHPMLLKLIAHMALSGGFRITTLEGAATFSGDEVLDVPGRPRVIPTPGHTRGHCALYFEDKEVLFVGDALCTRNPFTGRPGAQVMPSAMNISTDQCFESLAAIEEVPGASSPRGPRRALVREPGARRRERAPARKELARIGHPAADQASRGRLFGRGGRRGHTGSSQTASRARRDDGRSRPNRDSDSGRSPPRRRGRLTAWWRAAAALRALEPVVQVSSISSTGSPSSRAAPRTYGR